MDFFGYAAPEDEGICSAWIENFMDALEKKRICMHSVMLVRHGRVIADTVYEPLQKSDSHRMYSITKTFVGLAIGFLAEEHRLELDDPIVRYFPEKAPKTGFHPYIKMTTIRDMLRMATPHEQATCSKAVANDWSGSFFTVKPTRLPGTVFSYDSSASYVLGVLVEKLTGQTFLDYLRNVFLDRIDFSKEAYCVKSPEGYLHGASGLICTPMDVAKVAWILMHDGKYQGVRYLPEWYVREATKKQSDTRIKGKTIDEQQGYGYQLWMVRHGGYAMYGLGGQLALCLPREDLMLITTADTLNYPEGTQAIYDAFWSEIYGKLTDDSGNRRSMPEEKTCIPLSQRRILCEENEIASEWQQEVQDRVYLMEENAQGIETIKLHFEEREGILELQRAAAVLRFQFGNGIPVPGRFPENNMKCVTSAGWKDLRCWSLQCYLVDEEVGSLHMQLVWREDGRLSMIAVSCGGASLLEIAGSAAGYPEQ